MHDRAMLVNKGLEAGKKGRLQNPCMSSKDQRKQGAIEKGQEEARIWEPNQGWTNLSGRQRILVWWAWRKMGFWESRYSLGTICKICICVFHWKEDT